MRTPLSWLLSAVLTLVSGASLAGSGPPASERSYIEHPPAPNAPALPFSDAVRLGDTLYVAGHLGLDPATGNAAASAEVEARLVMDAVKNTLARAGYTMDDFVSVTVYCTDLALYQTFNSVYAGYFHGHHPARAFIGVSKLIRNARFEVQGVAVRTARP
ncbi:MAG TPA: Rid family hydrolase [Steroidobacteraceae bacterium]|nr:Rid family hydrolase [Steroidobacteraceae bacterium]